MLYQRKKYHRRASLHAVPEIPPLEQREEVCGQGFHPNRAEPGREVKVLEVYKYKPGRAPRVREVLGTCESGKWEAWNVIACVFWLVPWIASVLEPDGLWVSQ